MTDTIFVPSFGNRPRILVGREDILRQFELCLDSVPGSRERAVLLLGQRGYGKTVLLLELAERGKKHDCVVASPTIAANGMLSRILEKLREDGSAYLSKQKAKLAGGSVGVLGFSAGMQFQDEMPVEQSFAAQLSAICRELNAKGKSVLILIDEVQANHEELRQLIIAYQELVGEGRDIALVLAGLPAAISSTLNDHVLTFLNRASRLTLTPLRISDVDMYYQNAFRELGISLQKTDRQDLAEATNGSPYLMQLLGHYITVSADANGQLTSDRILSAKEHALTDYRRDICETTLAPLSDADVAFLIAMAEDEKESEPAALAGRMGVTSSYIQTYKRRLLQTGIIEQPARGKLRFAVPYLRDYLAEQNS